MDALTPPAVRVTTQSPEAVHAYAALISAQSQNAQLRDELQAQSAEISVYRDHARNLSSQLGHARAREWELMENVRLLQEKLASLNKR